MLASLLESVAMPFLGKFIDGAEDIWKQYLNNQITREELANKLSVVMKQSAEHVQVSENETIAKTFASFTQVLAQSKLMQIGWLTTLFSQLSVLLWYQVGVPAMAYAGLGSYPSAGTTLEWAYALVGFCLGAGPLIMNRKTV